MNIHDLRLRIFESGKRIAVIGGSLLFASWSPAQAAEQRTTFKEFRQNNPELNRQVRRQLFREQVRNQRANPACKIDSRVLTSGFDAPSLPLENRSNRLNRLVEPSGSVLRQTIQGADGANVVRLSQGVNLDLGSSERNITLGKKLFRNVGSVSVTVGGETKSFEAGSQVTASEYLAVKQILAGVGQQLSLDSSGRASGGHVDMSSVTSNSNTLRASDFIVPEKVTAYCDFSKRSDFKLLGDLSNFGTIHALTNNAGAIRAEDISNNVGALILSGTDLTLAASGNLTNQGTIKSSGTLNLSAGNVLKNSSEIIAAKDLSVYAPTTINSGVIQSSKGDVYIDGPTTAELRVEGNGGRIIASTGAINLRSFEYAETANTIVSGGDLMSRELKLNAGQGIMRVSADKITGTVFQTGSEAHIEASTENLVIGKVCLTGDPTFKNDAGNISITSDISVAEDLSIIASGNITSVDNITLQAANATQGFNINLIAGADQVVAGVNSSTAPVGGTADTTSLTGSASTNGGSILLGNNVTISTRPTGSTGSGGNVFVAAFAGGAAGSGTVDLGTTTILTGGRTSADNNGDVTVIAGALSTTAINIGTVATTGGALATGAINITTAQPTSSDGANIVFAADGSISSGNSLVAGAAIGVGADVIVRGNITSDDSLSVQAGGDIETITGVVADISVGADPTGAVIDADGAFAYVANSLDGTVTVINAVTNTVVGAPISVGLAPEQIALSPDGSLAYVSNTGSNSVSVIDTGSHMVIATVNVGASPTGITVNANGSRVYVSNSGSNTITAIDASTNQVIGSPIVTGASPNAVFVDGANARLYVGNTGGSSISVIDQATLTVIQTFSIPTAPVAFGGCPCGTKIFVAAQSDKVYAFSTESNSVVATIDLPAGANPVGIAINPTGSTAYTTNSGTGDVSVIVTLTNAIQENVPTGGTPQASGNFAGFVGNNPVLFVTDDASDSVRVLRTAALVAPEINLLSDAGKIFAATGPSSVTAVTTSDVTITASGSVKTGGPSSGNLFQFATRDDVTINHPLVIGSVMDMHAIDGVFTNNSSITVNGEAAFVASHQINNNGTMTAQSTSGSPVLVFQSPDGALSVTSNAGALFTATTTAPSGTARIEFNPAFGFSVIIQGGIFVADTNMGFRGSNGYVIDVDAERIDPPVKVNDVPQNVLIRTATGTLTLEQIITAATGGPIDLRANGGDLVVQGDLTSPASINLSAQGDLLNTNFGGAITTPSLTLTSTGGSIGTDALNPFVVEANTVNISGNALSAAGNVFVTSAATDGVNFENSQAGNDLFLSAAGSLTIVGDLTAVAGDLDVRAISADTNILTIADSISLTGFSSINVVNSTSSKKSQLILGSNSTIQTNAKSPGLGDVTIAVGPTIVPTGTKDKKPPRNTVVNETGGGQVSFTGKRSKGLSPTNTFTALGANILVSNDLKGRAIELQGGVAVTADPPVADQKRTVEFRLARKNQNQRRMPRVARLSP